VARGRRARPDLIVHRALRSQSEDFLSRGAHKADLLRSKMRSRACDLADVESLKDGFGEARVDANDESQDGLLALKESSVHWNRERQTLLSPPHQFRVRATTIASQLSQDYVWAGPTRVAQSNHRVATAGAPDFAGGKRRSSCAQSASAIRRK
jgi:hypothetical protein